MKPNAPEDIKVRLSSSGSPAPTPAPSIDLPHLQALWDPAPYAVWVHQDLRLVYLNTAAVESIGARSQEELLGRSPLDFISDDERAQTAARIEQVTREDAPVPLARTSFRRLDGSRYETRAVAWPILFQGRRAVQATFYDMTSLLEKEAALSRSEDLQSQILESLPQLIWTTKPDGAHDYFNKRWYDYTGTKPGQTDGAGWAAILHPDDVERSWAVWNHSLTTGDNYDIEYRFRAGDGSYRWFLGRARPLRDSTGKIVRWFGSCTDIDEPRRQRERLRASEERFRTATRAVSDIIWTNDAEGKMRGEQASWAAFTGQREEQYQGYGWTDALHPDDIASTLAAWESAVREKRMAVFEHRLRRHDGVYRLCLVRALPILDEDETIREWVGVHADVTERRQQQAEILALNTELEERVRQRTAELEASNKELEAFSYSVSHDLRAPLRTIDGFSLALEEDAGPVLDEECRGYIRRIRGGVQRMGGLIDALLQLSRVTRAELQRHDVDLSRIAQEVCEGLQRVQPERSVELRIAPELHANADLRLMQVAFENLFGNAFKFTSKQSHAVIEFGARPGEDASASTEFYIRDNGAGFDMQYAGKLFHAFQRLHGDKDFQGSGIGLATVERVIRRHGGTIRAESAPEGGATFRFTLG